MEKKRRYIISFIILCLAVLVFFCLEICLGSVRIPCGDIWDILLGKNNNGTNYNIVWEIRLPRAIAATLLGGALAVAGFLLQTFFSNPIAGPFVLGISSGAKLLVALTMIVFLNRGMAISSFSMIFAAFIGALLVTCFVLVMARSVRRMSVLVVCGIMVGYVCSAITDFAVTFADDSNIVNLHNWSLGSFSGISWANVRVMSVVVFVATLITFLYSKPMLAYQLGEGYAKNLGVNVKALRLIMIILSSVLAACVTAFAGPISFVGIAVPHLVRSLLRTSKPILVIPAAFLGGAVICLFSDIIARTMFAPVELSISSVTAVFLAPIVIYIMLRRKDGGV